MVVVVVVARSLSFAVPGSVRSFVVAVLMCVDLERRRNEDNEVHVAAAADGGLQEFFLLLRVSSDPVGAPSHQIK